MKDELRAVKKTLTIPAWLNEMAEAENIVFSKVLQNALMDKLDCHSYEEYCQLRKDPGLVKPVYCRECRHCTDGWICLGTGMMPAHSTYPDSYCSNGCRKE